MLNPKEKRKENKKYQFIHNTVVADREKKQNKARKLYLHKRICLWTEMARWVKELASWRKTHCVDISIFFLLTSFFLGFSKEGSRVIVPDLVNSLSPLSTPRIGS